MEAIKEYLLYEKQLMRPSTQEKWDLLNRALAEVEQISNRCNGCKSFKEMTKLAQYDCLPYPCRECARALHLTHKTDRYEKEQ